MAAKTVAKTFAPALPDSFLAGDIAHAFKKIGHFFAVGYEVFAEAQEEARKAHAKYPFAE
jgi:hypothetical protein